MTGSPEQILQAEKARVFSTHAFPSEFITEEFKKLVMKNMEFNSFRQLRVLMITYEKLCFFNEEFFLTEIEIAIEIAKSATPKELGVDSREYIRLLKEVVSPVADKFIEIAEELTTPLKRKISHEFRTKHNIPLNQKIFQD